MNDQTSPSRETQARRQEEAVELTGRWVREHYHQLHEIASLKMLGERKDHTLSATALVHEAYLRLQCREGLEWMSKRQFLALVASEMKRILVDAARAKQTQKRGHQFSRQAVDVAAPDSVADSLLDLTQAVDRLERVAPEKAELVRLRYYLGLTEAEAAEALGISRATASRHWAFARAWLIDFLNSFETDRVDQ